MQQAMAMTQQMMQPQGQSHLGAGGAGGGLGGGAVPPGANPFQMMMQQMNAGAAQGTAENPGGGFGPSIGGNPFQMMMQQQMNAGAPQGAAEIPPVPESVQRMRFASQLMQLANMGFTDESMCLRALAQHNGRLDSTIDVLLTGTVD